MVIFHGHARHFLTCMDGILLGHQHCYGNVFIIQILALELCCYPMPYVVFLQHNSKWVLSFGKNKKKNFTRGLYLRIFSFGATVNFSFLFIRNFREWKKRPYGRYQFIYFSVGTSFLNNLYAGAKRHFFLLFFCREEVLFHCVLMFSVGVGDYTWSNYGIMVSLMRAPWTVVIPYLSSSKTEMWILEKLEHDRKSFAVETVDYQNHRVVVGSEANARSAV